MSLSIHKLFHFGTEVLITSAKSVVATTVPLVISYNSDFNQLLKWGEQEVEELRRPRCQSGMEVVFLRIFLLRDFPGEEG